MKIEGNEYQPLRHSAANMRRTQGGKEFSLPDESAPEGTADVWSALSGEYDIRKATFAELNTLSAKLYKAGRISLFDHAMLTFDPSRSPQQAGATAYLTPADATGRRDWLAEYQARASRDLELGNPQGYRQNQNIANILKKLL